MSEAAVYLLRHGEIAFSGKPKRYLGQLDIELSPAGRAQAGALASWFAGRELGGICCSDLVRSRETASLIAAGRKLTLNPLKDLREISLGEWEGLTFADVCRRFPWEFKRRGEDLAGFRPPGGESFADLQERALAAFREIVKRGSGPWLIVGHAGINRVLLSHFLRKPLADIFKLPQAYGCLNLIKVGNHQIRVRVINARLLPAGGLSPRPDHDH